MNEYLPSVRKRKRTLLIVEGDHEKNILFKVLFDVFPELNINYDDVWIYGTNIYVLYQDIIKEYGEDWTEHDDDIDLPFVISKKKTPDLLAYKEDFSDIFLVFDYERQDPGFSEEKIVKLQNHFYDSTDMGKLYINYPMVESYQHFKSLPDPLFENRYVSVKMRNGGEYKDKVHNIKAISDIIWFPHKIDEILRTRYGVVDNKNRIECVDRILNIHNKNNLQEEVYSIIEKEVEGRNAITCKCQLIHMIDRMDYIENGYSYMEYAREILKKIIYFNICKANKITHGVYTIVKENYRNTYSQLDPTEILEKQNEASRDDMNGIIWVLNTCVFIIADYKFSLVE